MLKLLLNPKIDCSRVCTTWPISNIASNASFVVDITHLKHPDNVRKDFFGKWIHSGSHPFTFKASTTEDGEVMVEKCSAEAAGRVFYLRRLHSYHPSNADFRWMLAFVSGEIFNTRFNTYMHRTLLSEQVVTYYYQREGNTILKTIARLYSR